MKHKVQTCRQIDLEGSMNFFYCSWCSFLMFVIVVHFPTSIESYCSLGSKLYISNPFIKSAKNHRKKNYAINQSYYDYREKLVKARFYPFIQPLDFNVFVFSSKISSEEE